MPEDLVRWEVVTVILMLIGVGVGISIFWKHLVDVWRIRWIYLEHQLARAEGREPRTISEVFPGFFNLKERETETIQIIHKGEHETGND